MDKPLAKVILTMPDGTQVLLDLETHGPDNRFTSGNVGYTFESKDVMLPSMFNGPGTKAITKHWVKIIIVEKGSKKL